MRPSIVQLPCSAGQPIRIIGIMSGTSLDGVDLAACEFWEQDGRWSFQLLTAETVPYSGEWYQRLANAYTADALSLVQLDTDLGSYLGELTNDFIQRNKLNIQLIGSHGHTIFHRPDLGYTLQIGKGTHIAAKTGLPVVFDFRSKDVALGGQGAPLVPVGDDLLFHEYEACLNLGGIANISYNENGRRIAYDICPVNMALNRLAKTMGFEYDDGGELARSGALIPGLLNDLESLPFYREKGPKSLGQEWYENEFHPLLAGYPVKDVLRTVTQHIAQRLSAEINNLPTGSKVLVTGGGAFNTFLLNTAKEMSANDIVLPSADLIQFKEAVVFAFLAALHVCGRVNIYDSATGSLRSHLGGALVQGM